MPAPRLVLLVSALALLVGAGAIISALPHHAGADGTLSVAQTAAPPPAASVAADTATATSAPQVPATRPRCS